MTAKHRGYIDLSSKKDKPTRTVFLEDRDILYYDVSDTSAEITFRDGVATQNTYRFSSLPYTLDKDGEKVVIDITNIRFTLGIVGTKGIRTTSQSRNLKS